MGLLLISILSWVMDIINHVILYGTIIDINLFLKPGRYNYVILCGSLTSLNFIFIVVVIIHVSLYGILANISFILGRGYYKSYYFLWDYNQIDFFF